MRRTSNHGASVPRLPLLRFLPLLAAASLISACAIHPDPEDVTGVPTDEIVQQIRCETRRAVFDSAVGWLTSGDTDVDERSATIGQYFKDNQDKLTSFRPELFKGTVRNIFKLFWTTGVAYNYDLQMTEANNLGADVNLLKPFIPSSASLNLKGNFDRQRQNTRTFTITDTFGGLISKVPDSYCDEAIVTANYVYPIAGRIGMDRVVQTFVNLTLHANLSGDQKTAGAPPTMVDSLIFTTNVSGSAAPRVTFAPAGNDFRLSSGVLTADASRKDVHKITVGLALIKSSVPQLEPVRTALVGRLLTASVGATEQAAANAVDQTLTSQLFTTNVNIYQ